MANLFVVSFYICTADGQPGTVHLQYSNRQCWPGNGVYGLRYIPCIWQGDVIHTDMESLTERPPLPLVVGMYSMPPRRRLGESLRQKLLETAY
jgi:hypothetical protein